MPRNRNAKRLLRYLYGVEERVTNLEQDRPGETPTRLVENVTESATASDSVSDESRSDFTLAYDDATRGYGRTEYAAE